MEKCTERRLLQSKPTRREQCHGVRNIHFELFPNTILVDWIDMIHQATSLPTFLDHAKFKQNHDSHSTYDASKF